MSKHTATITTHFQTGSFFDGTVTSTTTVLFATDIT